MKKQKMKNKNEEWIKLVKKQPKEIVANDNVVITEWKEEDGVILMARIACTDYREKGKGILEWK